MGDVVENGTFSMVSFVASLRMCSGMIECGSAARLPRNSESGASSVIATVLSSGAVMPSTVSAVPSAAAVKPLIARQLEMGKPRYAAFMSAAWLTVNKTSFDVKGVPSCHFTPG